MYRHPIDPMLLGPAGVTPPAIQDETPQEEAWRNLEDRGWNFERHDGESIILTRKGRRPGTTEVVEIDEEGLCNGEDWRTFVRS